MQRDKKNCYINLHVDEKSKIDTLTLNNPDKFNALSVELGEELLATLEDVSRLSDARVLIITGAGKAFCAGGQFDDVLRANADPWLAEKSVRLFLDIVKIIRNMKIPVIAKINGDAIGGGCMLALCCDFKVASENARLGISFVKIGLSGCDMGATYLLPRLVGLTRATEYLMLGTMLPAAEAAQVGLLNQAVPVDQLDDVVSGIAVKLANGPALSLEFTKKALARAIDVDFSTELELEAYLQSLSIQSEDVREGVMALKEKRKPSFKGK